MTGAVAPPHVGVSSCMLQLCKAELWYLDQSLPETVRSGYNSLRSVSPFCSMLGGIAQGGSCMFFIGIFGVQSKSQILTTEVGTPCPICGAYDRYEILKAYTYFHVFFLPLWKWNTRYLLKTRCCQRLCALDATIGGKIEAGEKVEIRREQIACDPLPGESSYCSNCGRPAHDTHRFCPHCGTER